MSEIAARVLPASRQSRDMRVVVVGSSGIVGGAVARLLASRDYEVLGLSRHSTPALDLSRPGTITGALDQIEFDALVC